MTEISPARIETEVFARLLGDAERSPAALLRRLRGAEARGHRRIDRLRRRLAGAHDVTFMEVLPTLQVVGGLGIAQGPMKADKT